MTELLSATVAINKDVLKVIDGVQSFIDDTNRAMGQFEAATGGRAAPPLDDSTITTAIIEPRIAAIERLADGLPKPQPLNLASFDATSIGKLSPVERRARLRESVLACSASTTQLESDRSLLAQYTELEKAIGKTADLIQALGVRLRPLLAMATAPLPKSTFLANVGWLPIDLEENYPRRLIDKANALSTRRSAGESTLNASRHALKKRIASIDPALASELAALKERHEKFLARQREVDQLAQRVNDLEEQTIAAVNTRDATEQALAEARQAFDAATRAETQAIQRKEQADTAQKAAFETTKSAYFWCPERQPWSGCNHNNLKSAWVNTSRDSTAVAYRSALERDQLLTSLGRCKV